MGQEAIDGFETVLGSDFDLLIAANNLRSICKGFGYLPTSRLHLYCELRINIGSTIRGIKLGEDRTIPVKLVEPVNGLLEVLDDTALLGSWAGLDINLGFYLPPTFEKPESNGLVIAGVK